MDYGSARVPKPYLLLVMLIAWFALIAQFVLMINNAVVPMGETIIRFFSFFTILTNLIVAVSLTSMLFFPRSVMGVFFSRTEYFTANTVYIVIVCMVYNIVLRSLWAPQGLQKLVDELLHSVIPVLYLLLWLFFVPKRTLEWKDLIGWLAYPVLYIIYTIVRGELSGFYPYPFINVTDIGYPKALLHGGYVMIAFISVSLLFIAIGKLLAARKKWADR